MSRAKRNQQMTPRIPREQTLMCALRGPVMLITIGVLFLLDQFTGFGFSRTWPLILIVLGLMALADTKNRRFLTGGPSVPGVAPGTYPPPPVAHPAAPAPGYGSQGYGATGYGAPGYGAQGYGAPGYSSSPYAAPSSGPAYPPPPASPAGASQAVPPKAPGAPR